MHESTLQESITMSDSKTWMTISVMHSCCVLHESTYDKHSQSPLHPHSSHSSGDKKHHMNKEFAEILNLESQLYKDQCLFRHCSIL